MVTNLYFYSTLLFCTLISLKHVVQGLSSFNYFNQPLQSASRTPLILLQRQLSCSSIPTLHLYTNRRQRSVFYLILCCIFYSLLPLLFQSNKEDAQELLLPSPSTPCLHHGTMHICLGFQAQKQHSVISALLSEGTCLKCLFDWRCINFEILIQLEIASFLYSCKCFLCRQQMNRMSTTIA